MDEAVVGGDRADLGEAAGVVGGEFVEGAVGVEQVALGGDLAGDAAAAERVAVEGGIALGQTPALAVVVGEDDGGGVDGERRRRGWRCSPWCIGVRWGRRRA